MKTFHVGITLDSQTTSAVAQQFERTLFQILPGMLEKAMPRVTVASLQTNSSSWNS